MVLGVDIGGGSTEFVIGKQGRYVFGASLKLGHVSLTQKFGNSVDQIKEHIRVLWKDWRLSRGEVKGVVESLCGGGEGEKISRKKFFERRSEFIVAGSVLLEEIFEVLGIEEMEVSGYALAEGVIAESLAKVNGGYALTANASWSSVFRLAMWYNGKKRMKAATQCAITAKEIFEGLRKCDDLADNQFAASLDDKDLEYLEAASLLHNIGVFTGKKDYHKHSYCIIMIGEHLHGYSSEEVKIKLLYTIKPLAEDTDDDELRQELEYFNLLFFEELHIVAPLSVPDPRVNDILR
ncbi:hypothetical protein ACLB2K_060827 [Fragaria x ananassa]